MSSKYKFIEPLKTAPKIEKKGKKKSLGEKIIMEFETAGVDYAKVRKEKLEGYKSTISAARAMGRILNSMKLADKINVYSDADNVYLEKKV